MYFWLCWVVVAGCGLSGVMSRGSSLLRCSGCSLLWLLLLQSTGSRRWASITAALGSSTVAHRISCSVACRIFLNQGSNPRSLPWQGNSYPLYHQGSPVSHFFTLLIMSSNAQEFLFSWNQICLFSLLLTVPLVLYSGYHCQVQRCKVFLKVSSFRSYIWVNFCMWG